MAVRNLALALWLLATLTPGLAAAQDAPAKPPAAVEVKVATIHARVGAGPAAAPDKLAARLSKAFPGHQGFVVLDTTTLALATGGTGQVPLPGGKSLEVTYLGRAEKHLRLRVVLPDKVRTEVRVADGATFYQAGMEHDGGVLILALQATTKDEPVAPVTPAPDKKP